MLEFWYMLRHIKCWDPSGGQSVLLLVGFICTAIASTSCLQNFFSRMPDLTCLQLVWDVHGDMMVQECGSPMSGQFRDSSEDAGMSMTVVQPDGIRTSPGL